MKYGLSFCEVIQHHDALIEIIVDEGVDLNTDHAQEFNQLTAKICQKPYGRLVNMRNTFSVNIEGIKLIGNSPLEKKVGVLIFRNNSETIIKLPLKFHQIQYPNKQVKIFQDRKQAIAWLEEI